MNNSFSTTRRKMLAMTGIGIATLAMPSIVRANTFPSRNINVTIPTGEGGGADTSSRAFAGVWRKYLPTNFEFGFFPGASGQVGYEHYMQRVDKDPHNLLSSYIGPEVIMLALQAPHIKPGEDFVYFQQFSDEPMAIYVGAQSSIESIEQLVELGRQRTVTVSKSRLPHPASICMLSLAQETGMEVNLVPYGGGNPASMAAITGEVDCCALPVSLPIALGDQVRVLGVFSEINMTPDQTGNAPTINDALDLSVPNITSARAWAIHRETIERFPEEYAILRDTARKVVEDPEFIEAMGRTGVPAEFISVGGEDVAMASANATAPLAERYRDLLTAG
jgi:tripartite-type tricarboxylate transporter receptor subunit TctC